MDPSTAGTNRLALDRAGELDARMSGLRAASALGRLWHAEGRSEAVAGMLGPVLATFTDGFATADLIEARALMGKVAPGRPTAS